MVRKRIRGTAFFTAASILLFVAYSTLASASAGSANDADDATGVDIKTVQWSDTTTDVTLGFTTYEAMAGADIRSEWLFDLNGNGVPEEACVLVKVVANNPIYEFYNSGTCGPEVARSDAVARPTNDSMQLVLPIQALRDAGLSQSATQYRFRARSTTTSNDKVPDQDTELLTHFLGSATAPPSATPTPTSSPTASPTTEPTATPTATPCPTPSPTPSPSTSPTATPTTSPSSGCDTTAQGTASKTTVAPGDSVEISGSGYQAESQLDIEFRSDVKELGTITSNASGGFTTAVRIPTDASAGTHHIAVLGANGQGGTHTTLFPVAVTSSSGQSGGTLSSSASGSGAGTSASGSGVTLPRTGASILALIVVALLLVLGGITVVDESSMWRLRLKTSRSRSAPPSDREA